MGGQLCDTVLSDETLTFSQKSENRPFSNFDESAGSGRGYQNRPEISPLGPLECPRTNNQHTTLI